MRLSRVPLVVSNSDELHQLSGPLTSTRITLQIPLLSHEEQIEWQNKIDSAVHACGCGEGAAFLLVTLLLLGLLAIPLWYFVRGHPILFGILSMMFACSSIAAGKWFGKARAARKLKRYITALRGFLEARASESCITYKAQPSAIAQGDFR